MLRGGEISGGATSAEPTCSPAVQRIRRRSRYSHFVGDTARKSLRVLAVICCILLKKVERSGHCALKRGNGRLGRPLSCKLHRRLLPLLVHFLHAESWWLSSCQTFKWIYDILKKDLNFAVEPVQSPQHGVRPRATRKPSNVAYQGEICNRHCRSLFSCLSKAYLTSQHDLETFTILPAYELLYSLPLRRSASSDKARRSRRITALAMRHSSAVPLPRRHMLTVINGRAW